MLTVKNITLLSNFIVSWWKAHHGHSLVREINVFSATYRLCTYDNLKKICSSFQIIFPMYFYSFTIRQSETDEMVSAEEKNTVFRIFQKNIAERKLPSFTEIQKAIRENESLQHRTSPQIKTWIHNQFKNEKRLSFSK